MPDAVEYLYQCNSCRLCTEWCIYDDLVVSDLLMEARRRIVEESKESLPEYVNQVLKKVENDGSPFAATYSKASRMVRDQLCSMTSPVGNVLYYEDCISKYHQPEITVSSLKLLKKAGLEPIYLPEQEPCCGAVIDMLGFREQAYQAGEKTLDFLMNVNVERIITSSPLSAFQLTRGFNQLGLKHALRVQTMVEFIAENLLDGKLNVQNALEKKVVVDDDPMLVRYLKDDGSLEVIFQSLPGLEVIKTEPFGLMGRPAVSYSPLPSSNVEKEITHQKAEEHIKTGADWIITSSPKAKMDLGQVIPESVKVLDIVELINNAVD